MKRISLLSCSIEHGTKIPCWSKPVSPAKFQKMHLHNNNINIFLANIFLHRPVVCQSFHREFFRPDWLRPEVKHSLNISWFPCVKFYFLCRQKNSQFWPRNCVSHLFLSRLVLVVCQSFPQPTHHNHKRRLGSIALLLTKYPQHKALPPLASPCRISKNRNYAIVTPRQS